MTLHTGASKCAAWSGLSKAFSDPTNIDTCLQESGLSEVIKVPAFVEMPTISRSPLGEVDVEEVMTRVSRQNFLARDGRVISPTSVKDGYAIGQPSAIVDTIRSFVDQGWASVEAIFPLYGGGADCFVLALDVPGFQTVADGDSTWYMVVINYHGRGSCKAKVLRYRHKCRNIGTAAFASGSDWAIRHSGDFDSKLAWAARTWKEAKDQITDIAHKLDLFMDCTLPIKDTVTDILGVDEKSSTRKQNQRDEIVSFACNSVNYCGPNALSVLNGFTGWATHDLSGKAGKSAESRLESHIDGARGQLEQKAVKYLLDMVAA